MPGNALVRKGSNFNNKMYYIAPEFNLSFIEENRLVLNFFLSKGSSDLVRCIRILPKDRHCLFSRINDKRVFFFKQDTIANIGRTQSVPYPNIFCNILGKVVSLRGNEV